MYIVKLCEYMILSNDFSCKRKKLYQTKTNKNLIHLVQCLLNLIIYNSRRLKEKEKTAVGLMSLLKLYIKTFKDYTKCGKDELTPQ